MSESAKRPGVRDISDLKARLGLKKKGPASTKGARAGVVPPPGVANTGGAGGPVPAPPGAQPPAAPPGPKVSDDPFGALNAAASAPPAVHRGPEIVVIEKGESVESIEHKSTAIKVAKIGGLVLVPLILGMAMGQIGTNAKQFNRTIRDASSISSEVKRVRKEGLKEYQRAFQAAQKKGFTKYDKDLTAALAKVKFDGVNQETIYKSWLYELNPDLVNDVLYFASETTRLVQDIRAHVTLTRRDADPKNKAPLVAASANIKKSKPDETENEERYTPFRYAVISQVPSQEEAQSGKKKFGAYVVEIGAPICRDPGNAKGKVSQTGECPEPPIGFRTRTGPDEPWQSMMLAQPLFGSGKVDQGSLQILQPNGTMIELIKGNKESLSEMAYQKRVVSLFERTKELVQLATGLEGALNSKSSEGSKFTFFL